MLEQGDITKKSMREKARYLQGAYNQQLAAEKAKQLVGILWAFKMNVFCILWSVVTYCSDRMLCWTPDREVRDLSSKLKHSL